MRKYRLMFINSRRFILLPLVFILCLCAIELFARAGGGQSFHSSGGSTHYSSGGSSFHSSGSGFSSHGMAYGSGSGGFFNIIIIILIIVVILYVVSKNKSNGQQRDFRSTLDPNLQAQIRSKPLPFSESAIELEKKMGEAFVAIQNAWSNGKMDPVRSILSDGVYHRFQIQLDMNRLQGLRNQVDKPTLLEAKILGETFFGRYCSVNLLIRGRVVDTDFDLKTNQIAKGGQATVFQEIWAFTRLSSSHILNPLQSLANCSKCAAPLTDAGGSRCSHCGAVLNSGSNDWVLSEITQSEVWQPNEGGDLESFYQDLPSIAGTDSKDWLSPQELEDRASVVFIRYHNALHRGNLGSLNIFLSPELLRKLQSQNLEKPTFQLAVGSVELQGFAKVENDMRAWIRIKYSSAENPREEGTFRERVLVFSKALTAAQGKGNMSSMTCPSCGGPIESSDQAKCAYCEALLSSPETNWVLTGYGSLDLLQEMRVLRSQSEPVASSKGAYFSGGADEQKNASILQSRILSAIIGASLEDQVITEGEEKTIREFARHFGMGHIFVDMLLKKAKENPSFFSEKIDGPLAKMWMNNFILIAASDGIITPDEMALLVSFGKKNGMDEKQIKYALQASLKMNQKK